MVKRAVFLPTCLSIISYGKRGCIYRPTSVFSPKPAQSFRFRPYVTGVVLFQVIVSASNGNTFWSPILLGLVIPGIVAIDLRKITFQGTMQ